MLNAAPVLVHQLPLTANPSTPRVLTSTDLLATDADNSPAEITFQLAAVPTNGVLRRDANPLAIGDAFSQQDVNTGRISYVYRAGPLTDSFAFALTDSALESVTTLVSQSDAGEIGDSDSFVSSISSDGRYVAFDSSAFNLTAESANEADDVFLRDRRQATTILASITPGLETGNAGSLEPSISADGRFVAFQSVARDLVGGDTNNTTDNSFKRDAQIGLSLASNTGPASWTITQATDATDYGNNDGVATVQATSNGVGRANFNLAVTFVTDTFGTFAAGNYETTVTGTVTAN
ncbi:MAG: hypothetical protein JNM18_13100 [Planctomycetaceae bacterium]|nr:hypothetical protein [Planctomycetaceae bacterium]